MISRYLSCSKDKSQVLLFHYLSTSKQKPSQNKGIICVGQTKLKLVFTIKSNHFIIIFSKERKNSPFQGASNKNVDQILPNYDPLPLTHLTSRQLWTFYKPFLLTLFLSTQLLNDSLILWKGLVFSIGFYYPLKWT